MITVFDRLGRQTEHEKLSEAIFADDPSWVDIDNPTSKDREFLEAKFGVPVPPIEAFEDATVTTRFEDDSDIIMFTPNLLCLDDKHGFANTPMTFLLSDSGLVTLRRRLPVAVAMLHDQLAHHVGPDLNGPRVFFQLMMCVAQDYAARMQLMGDQLNSVIREVLDNDFDGSQSKAHRDQVARISRAEYLNGRILNSLVGIDVFGDYIAHLDSDYAGERKRFNATIASLMTAGGVVSDRVDFALNAVMSVIGLEQNRIVNVLSVFTVVLAPPTLLAGIWGMNFQHMPELSWPLGYLFALIIIALSAIIPYRIVTKLGWL